MHCGGRAAMKGWSNSSTARATTACGFGRRRRWPAQRGCQEAGGPAAARASGDTSRSPTLWPRSPPWNPEVVKRSANSVAEAASATCATEGRGRLASQPCRWGWSPLAPSLVDHRDAQQSVHIDVVRLRFETWFDRQQRARRTRAGTARACSARRGCAFRGGRHGKTLSARSTVSVSGAELFARFVSATQLPST